MTQINLARQSLGGSVDTLADFYAPESRFFWAGDPLGGAPDHTTGAGAPGPAMKRSIGPVFVGYGPMIADGPYVVREWETFLVLDDGSVYNNYYCYVFRFTDGQVIASQEYLDTHHSWVVMGRWPPWPSIAPARERRQYAAATGAARSVVRPASNIQETVCEFDLDARLIRDPVRPLSGAEIIADGTRRTGKELVAVLRQAQEAGDLNAVAACFSPGHRRFMAGDRPLGWRHLPLEEIYAPLVAHLASPLRLRFGPLIGEGDSVAQEMESFARLDDGTVYNNWHCLIYQISEGQIVETREYLDTHHLWVTLGRWANWGHEAVMPPRHARASNLPAIELTTQIATIARLGGR